MSMPTYGHAGNIAFCAMDLVWIRHGGGADPGKYHVFTCGCGGWVRMSVQCVVDDFGTLVRVA